MATLDSGETWKYKNLLQKQHKAHFVPLFSNLHDIFLQIACNLLKRELSHVVGDAGSQVMYLF